MSQPDAWRMIRHRGVTAGIADAIECHNSFTTGITAYRANSGALRADFGVTESGIHKG